MIDDFQVKYAPKVVITTVEGALDTGRIPIGNSIRLRCNADANPNELTYQWYINDEMIIDATFSDLVKIVHNNIVSYCLPNAHLTIVLFLSKHKQNNLAKQLILS